MLNSLILTETEKSKKEKETNKQKIATKCMELKVNVNMCFVLFFNYTPFISEDCKGVNICSLGSLLII